MKVEIIRTTLAGTREVTDLVTQHGHSAKVKAVPGAKFSIAIDGVSLDGAQHGKGPKPELKKVGNDLLVKVDGETVAEITDYYAVQGAGLEGSQWSYPVTGHESLASVDAMGDAGGTADVEAAGAGASGSSALVGGLLLAGGIGVAAAMSGGGGGGSSGGGSNAGASSTTNTTGTPNTPAPSAPVSPPMSTVTGTVVAGPVVKGNGLSVTLYRADGTILANAVKVNADGTYTSSYTASYTGPILARVTTTGTTAADYIDEATGTPKHLDRELRAVFVGNGNTSISINPITELAVRALGKQPSDVNLGNITAAQVTAANQDLAAKLGLGNNLFSTPVTVIDASGKTVASPNLAGYLLAAISGMEALHGSGKAQELLAAAVTATSNDALVGNLITGAKEASAGSKIDYLGAIVSMAKTSNIAKVISEASTMTNDTLVALTAEGLQKIKPSVLAALTSEQIAKIPAAAAAGLTVDQLHVLSTAHLKSLSPDAQLSLLQLQQLTSTQLDALLHVSSLTLKVTKSGSDVAVGGAAAHEALINDAKPILSGSLAMKVPAGVVVGIYDGASRLGSAVLNADGKTWSYSTTTALPEGTHALSVRIEIPSGQISGAAAKFDLTVDVTPPTIAIGKVAGDDIINVTEKAHGVTLSGTTVGAEDGQTVSVKWGSVTKTAVVKANAWSVDFATGDLPTTDGKSTITVDVKDAAGNAATTVSHDVTTNTTLPTAPTVTLGEGVADGATFLKATQSSGIVKVSGENGATIAVTFTHGAKTLTKTLTGTGSDQAVVLNEKDLLALGNGPITVSATATNAVGNVSTAGASAFVLDTILPALKLLGSNTGGKHTVSAPTPDKSYSLDGTIPGEQAQLSDASKIVSLNFYLDLGRAKASAGEVLTVGGTALNLDGTKLPTSVTVGGATWKVSYESYSGTNPDNGNTIENHYIRLSSSAADGVTSDLAQQLIRDVTYMYAGKGVPSRSVSIVVSDAAGNASLAETVTFDTAPSIVISDVATDNRINATEKAADVAVSGTTTLEDNSTITVHWGSATHTATVSKGTWTTTFKANEIPADGTTSITADGTNAEGRAATQAVKSILVDSVAPELTLAHTAAGAEINLAESTAAAGVLSVKTEAAATVNVTLTGTNSATVTKTLTGNGTDQAVVLTSEDVTKLAQGKVTANVTATDAAGNVTTVATGGDFTLKTTAPTLTITSDKSTLKIGETAKISFTFSETPIGFDMSKVTVANGTLSEFAADKSNDKLYTATFTPTAQLSNAAASITVAAGVYTDKVGNEGAVAATSALTIYTAMPTVAIGTVATDDKVNATEKEAGVTITGSTSGVADNSEVTVKWGEKSKTATVSKDVWSVKFDKNDVPADGSTSITANVSDAGGNKATEASHGVTVLTMTPTTPVVTLGDSVDVGATSAKATQAGGVVTVNATKDASVSVTFTQGDKTVNHVVTGTGAAQAVSLTSDEVTTLGDGTVSVNAVVTDAAGNHSTAATTSFKLDTAAPTISSVVLSSTSTVDNSTLKAGDNATVTVTFSEAVNVTGTPEVTLDIGGKSVAATYKSGTGTTALVFGYTIAVGQNDSDGIALPANKLDVKGGKISDAAGNDAALTYTQATDNSAYKVDTTGQYPFTKDDTNHKLTFNEKTTVGTNIVMADYMAYDSASGIKKVDLSADLAKHILDVSKTDVSTVADNHKLYVTLGKQDLIKASGFDKLEYGRWTDEAQQVYDRHWTHTENSTTTEMFSFGGVQGVGFVDATWSDGKTVKFTFDQTVTGNSKDNWTSSAGSISAEATNGNEVTFTLSGAESEATSVMTLTYNGSSIANEAGEGLKYTRIMVTTSSSNTADGSAYSKNQALVSSGGDDTLKGGVGSDLLVVNGAGKVTMTGGAGADTFSWAKGASGTDTVTDFKLSEGDRIDLSGILAGKNVSATNVSNFLELTQATGTNNAVLKVDLTGAGNFSAAGEVITLNDAWADGNLQDHSSLATLLQQRVLIA